MRADVAAELEALQSELAERAPDVTQALLPFRNEINDNHERQFPAGDAAGEAIIILTAGVPGAGKSTLVNEIADNNATGHHMLTVVTGLSQPRHQPGCLSGEGKQP